MKRKRTVSPSFATAKLITLFFMLLLLVIIIMMFLPRTKAPTTNPEYLRLKRELGRLERVYRKNPRDLTAATNYAFALYATRNNAQAIKVYNQVAKLNEHDARALNILGNLYRKSNRYQRARDAYSRSIKADPEQINAYVNLANLYVRDLNQPSKGKQVFAQVLRKNPQNLALKDAYDSLVK